MKRCRAAAYLVEVRKLNARASDNLKFGSFNGKDHLRSVLQKILARSSKFKKLPLYNKTVKVELDRGNSGPLSGILWSGDYGQSGDIVDSNDGTVSYTKKNHESLPEPFYFYLALPDAGKRGILVLQQMGTSGIKSVFDAMVAGVFDREHSEYRLHVRNLTTADALAEYLRKGVIEDITVEKHEIPADIADRFGGNSKVYPGKFVYSIRPDSGALFKRDGLIAYAEGKKELGDVFDFADIGFDVVRTHIRVGGELKAINLTKPDRISSTYDITDDVTFGPTGYPTKASLVREFQAIVADLAKRGGIKL